jgi:enamine deaminase RidA (YjgF/YER057c/UK114 family)
MIGERVFSGLSFEDMAGYARAVVTRDQVFISGTTGFDPVTKQFPPDIETQTENCFRTIAAALEQAGGSLADLVRLRIFVASREEFARAVPIIRKHSMAARPANTTVVSQLLTDEMRIEIEATALRRG